VLIAIRMPDQRTAMIATLLGLLFPTIILSGFIFPISSLPGWLQPLTRVIPATYYIVITRGIMLKDVGLDVLWPQFAVLTGMAAALIGVSTRALQDRL
jgi:ABC-2 type transport system permease protein